MPKNTPVIQELTEQEKNQSSVAVRVGGAAAQNTMRNIGLIVGREYKNRLSQRSFIISTIVILVLVLIGACVPTVFQYFPAILERNSMAMPRRRRRASLDRVTVGSLVSPSQRETIALACNKRSGMAASICC